MASQVFMIMSNGAKLQGRGGVSSGKVPPAGATSGHPSGEVPAGILRGKAIGAGREAGLAASGCRTAARDSRLGGYWPLAQLQGKSRQPWPWPTILVARAPVLVDLVEQLLAVGEGVLGRLFSRDELLGRLEDAHG